MNKQTKNRRLCSCITETGNNFQSSKHKGSSVEHVVQVRGMKLKFDTRRFLSRDEETKKRQHRRHCLERR